MTDLEAGAAADLAYAREQLILPGLSEYERTECSRRIRLHEARMLVLAEVSGVLLGQVGR